VLVIPEDPTYNGYILEPLVTRLMADCGKGNANIKILTNPKVSGFEDARQKIPNIAQRYSHFDLLLFMVDNDGQNRTPSLDHIESTVPRLIGCAAVEEIEAWLLAGHIEKLGRSWSIVRSDTSVKENIFGPFLDKFGNMRRAGGGRDLLMQETLSNYSGLLERCPELATLRDKISSFVK
jgi:hypothetical protein